MPLQNRYQMLSKAEYIHPENSSYYGVLSDFLCIHKHDFVETDRMKNKQIPFATQICALKTPDH